MMGDRFITGLKINWDGIGRDSYLRRIPALQDPEELWFDESVTFFVGENGAGKSTLLEAAAVAYGFNPEGGSRNFSFSTRDSHSELCRSITLYKGWKMPSDDFFLRAESFYNVATKVDEYDDGTDFLAKNYGGRSLHSQSHGESFLALIQNHFRPRGLYLLDEPEAALSPQRQLSLLLRVFELSRQGSQFIIATHSPILLGLPGAAILSFDGGRIREIDYEETDSYRTTELFINHRGSMLKQLLDYDLEQEER